MGNGTIVGLLTGGGFLFLGTMLVPLLSKRLNKAAEAAAADKVRAERINIISEAATEVVTLLRVQLKSAEDERSQLQVWVRRKAKADLAHAHWDRDVQRKFDLLVDQCRTGGIDVDDDLHLHDPPSLDVPFDDLTEHAGD